MIANIGERRLTAGMPRAGCVVKPVASWLSQEGGGRAFHYQPASSPVGWRSGLHPVVW